MPRSWVDSEFESGRLRRTTDWSIRDLPADYRPRCSPTGTVQLGPHATATPLPTDIRPGTEIEYRVRTGDSLFALAVAFNTTEEAIIEATNEYRVENDLEEIEDNNDIFVGDILIIPVNLVTPVPTATNTPEPTETPEP